jgi:hypothetical protein
MNSELIKTLADEARIKPMGSSWAYRLANEFEEEFARLIVRECASIASNPATGCYTSFGNDIKKHFGVEE